MLMESRSAAVQAANAIFFMRLIAQSLVEDGEQWKKSVTS